MEVTLLGIVTEVKPLQPEKVLYPMEVTELPMVSDLSLSILPNGELVPE